MAVDKIMKSAKLQNLKQRVGNKEELKRQIAEWHEERSRNMRTVRKMERYEDRFSAAFYLWSWEKNQIVVLKLMACRFEWSDVKQYLKALQSVKITEKGKRFAILGRAHRVYVEKFFSLLVSRCRQL